ncbi:MAG: ribosome maturation factor RimP [Idiomarina sp.]
MARIEDRIADLIEPAVAALEFELWGVEYVRAGKHSTLRVYIDHADGVSVDDCADVSRQASAVLDVEDPITSEYFLEVSSPGMERPFFKAHQYTDYIGEQVAVELSVPQQGKRKFKAQIAGVDGTSVQFIVGSGEQEQTLSVTEASIKKAHLIPQF